MKPCEKCGGNHWRTIIKGRKWQCVCIGWRGRAVQGTKDKLCGYIRDRKDRDFAAESEARRVLTEVHLERGKEVRK